MDIIGAYEILYGPPNRTVQISRRKAPDQKYTVVVYLPDEVDQQDPEGNLTLLGTAGFAAQAICDGYPCELGMEIEGPLDDVTTDALAEALIDLGSAPVDTGRPFERWQILTGVNLPSFPRFTTALLVERNPVGGFHFPIPGEEIGFLRVVPIFDSEATFVEESVNRMEAYLRLFHRGMEEANPNREPVA